MGEPGLVLRDIEIALNGKALLAVSAHVAPSQTLTLMGPSGSGKSSLLAYIGGFLDPTFKAKGNVLLDGEEITHKPAHERRTGILFQDPLLFPHMSVGENLLFAVPQTVNGSERRTRCEQALEDAELSGFFDRDPATLSGGQKARVALMRVLLSRPKALLLDEPFSKLDTDLRDQVRRFVFAEAARQNLPVLLVTHDEADATAAGGEIIRLD
ncbi:ATP-binding cassette domain-containing protein [Pseudahrensia aquimaris]|uniref:ATP-binding cassette domain-containing protein n=1 Tax=Pseudahrensia aquimaris TaxID=744461 RepID=A0ABW3FF19_9HYPH